jgi:hypothetical protein
MRLDVSLLAASGPSGTSVLVIIHATNILYYIYQVSLLAAAGASGSCLGGKGSEGCEKERVVVGVVTGRVEGGKFRVSFPHPSSTPIPYIDLLLPSPHVRLL